MKNPFKKKKVQGPTLSQVVANHLRLSGYTVDEDQFSDGSARWVEVHKNGYTVTIDFDMSGNRIKGMELHQDILQVVDQKKLF